MRCKAIATGYWTKTVTLLDEQDIAIEGDWFMIGRYLSPTIVIQGLEAGGGISIRVSNNSERDKPVPEDLGVVHSVLGNVDADIAAPLGGSFTWIRAIKTAGPSPTETSVKAQMQVAK